MRVWSRRRRERSEVRQWPARMQWRDGFGGLLLLIVFLGFNTPGSAQEVATPELDITPGISVDDGETGSCLVGLAIESIHNLDLGNRTFDAAFWIWSVCEDDRFTPLDTMEFVNANSIVKDMDGVEMVDGVSWSYARVTGTFRHHWDLSRYPFDQQILNIVMEETAYVAGDFSYEADTSDPIPVPESERHLDHWKITDTSLEAGSAHYLTSYGDPRDPHGSSDYSQLVLSVTFERTDLTGFIKLTFVVYIAFLISLLSYFLHLDPASLLLARFSVISATVFAVALSMNRVTSELGTEDGITLIDKIHVVALVAILIDAIAAMVTHMRIARGSSMEDLGRFNRFVMAAVVIAFVAANVFLIGRAAFV